MQLRILFYFGHPAQFQFARNAIKALKQKGHKVIILIKTKDVLERLLKDSGLEYHNILSEGRKDSRIGILWGLLKRDWRLYRFIRKQKKVDIMVGSDPSLAHVGKLMGIPVITALEDDAEIIPQLVKITYPFTTHILVPNVCKVGEKYEKKKIGYDGFMKLGYLHPNQFTPEKSKAPDTSKPYILIRLAKLTAYHDEKIKGLDIAFIDRLIKILDNRFHLFINSEYPLPENYEKYRLKTAPGDIHHVMYFSSLFISDSQSMSVEAAMLGIPSIRYSDFSGRISVLEELEHKYKLTFGIKTTEPEKLFNKVEELLKLEDLRNVFQERRQAMLSDKIDVASFLVWFIENYPNSVNVMRDNPDYQYNFK